MTRHKTKNMDKEKIQELEQQDLNEYRQRFIRTPEEDTLIKNALETARLKNKLRKSGL